MSVSASNKVTDPELMPAVLFQSSLACLPADDLYYRCAPVSKKWLEAVIQVLGRESFKRDRDFLKLQPSAKTVPLGREYSLIHQAPQALFFGLPTDYSFYTRGILNVVSGDKISPWLPGIPWNLQGEITACKILDVSQEAFLCSIEHPNPGQRAHGLFLTQFGDLGYLRRRIFNLPICAVVKTPKEKLVVTVDGILRRYTANLELIGDQIRLVPENHRGGILSAYLINGYLVTQRIDEENFVPKKRIFEARPLSKLDVPEGTPLDLNYNYTVVITANQTHLFVYSQLQSAQFTRYSIPDFQATTHTLSEGCIGKEIIANQRWAVIKLTGEKKGLYVIDLIANKCQGIIPFIAHNVKLLNGDRLLATSLEDNTIQVWNLRNLASRLKRRPDNKKYAQELLTDNNELVRVCKQENSQEIYTLSLAQYEAETKVEKAKA